MANAQVITYKGIRFRRYPDSPKWAERSYYVPGIADRQRGVRRLHEEIWIDANGPIPDGCHIHHDDHDPLNNDPGNLVCLSEDEHKDHHGSDRRGVCTDEQAAHLAAVRPLTVAWHGSEAGLAWHSENGKRAWAARQAIPATCEQCGTGFESITLRANDRFCSNACKSAWRRASGLDDVERTCHCGSAFRVNKYSKTAHCSRSCGRRCYWAGGCPGVQPDGQRVS